MMVTLDKKLVNQATHEFNTMMVIESKGFTFLMQEGDIQYYKYKTPSKNRFTKTITMYSLKYDGDVETTYSYALAFNITTQQVVVFNKSISLTQIRHSTAS